MPVTLQPMTFEQMRDAAAADLREVAKLISERADEVAKGDMEAYYTVFCEDFAKFQEMLMIRQSHRAERREVTEQGITVG